MMARHRNIWLILSYSLLVHSLRIPLPLRSPSASLAASQSRRQLAQREARQNLEDGSGQSPTLNAPPPPPSFPQEEERPSKARPNHGSDAESTKDSDKDMSASSTKHQKNEDEVEGKSEKKGKKAKHVPGQHHRDDRISDSGSGSDVQNTDKDERGGRHSKTPKHKSKSKSNSSHRSKGKHGKEEKRYLSSSPRVQPKRSMSLWDYDRNSKRIGEFNPVLGMESIDWWNSAIPTSGEGHLSEIEGGR